MNLDEKQIFKKVIVGFGIIILILILSLFSISYEAGVQKCVNLGNSEEFCREELGK